MTSFTLQIASLPDRENPVIEIWIGDNQFAEISNENAEMPKIEIFQPSGGTSWEFTLEELRAILAKAESNLE